MANWHDVFRRPTDQAIGDWLGAIAHRLLNGVRLVVADEPHRLVEVEAYYHSQDHSDPFAHRDPVQLECGRWYFHKTHGVYRSGSFKGLDVSFGDGKAHGGILFRGLETPDGKLIDGPSLLVDYLLTKTGTRSVSSFDMAVAKRLAWDADNVLRLDSIDDEVRPVYTSTRVGLSLKRTKATPENLRFLLQPYRFLTEPRRTAKGKVHMVLSLRRQGYQEDVIKELTGCPITAIRRHLTALAEVTPDTTLAEFAGKNLGPRELCLLHGLGDRQ
jgi:3-methyladenine DNA glycosylase Mpg